MADDPKGAESAETPEKPTEPAPEAESTTSSPEAASEAEPSAAATESEPETPAEAAASVPAAAAPSSGIRWNVVGIGAALVLLPGAFVAYLIGRPMTIKQELGFPTLIAGQTGYSLHPSTLMFWLGVVSVLLVGAGAGVIFSGLAPSRHASFDPVERGLLPWLRRHAWSVGLFLLALLVLFPTMGTAGLWDPWESHYGLVGLRMVEQDDWISTCDMGWTEWFFSKPILLFWLMGLGIVGLGQDGAADGNPGLIEWAFRLPIAIFAVCAVMAVYLLASRRWGKRAGFLAGLALLTMPQFFLIARQAMTDMPFVAPLTVGLCLLGLALGEPFERPAASASLFRGRLRVSSFHVLLVAITVVSLPQALLVLTHSKTRSLAVYKANAPAAEIRRVENDRRLNDDTIIWGSLGQAEDGHERCRDFDCSKDPDRPGAVQINERYRPEAKIAHYFPRPGMTHRFWGAVFLLLWAGALYLVSRRTADDVAGPTQRDVYLYGFYLAAGVATLAKGLLGFAIPGLIVFLYLAVSGEWRELKRLRILRGAVVFLAAAFPWYAMMVVRHGNAWFQQFIIHDHFKRSASGVHGDRGALGYFVEQLGVGTFPWAGFIPAALLAVLWVKWKRDRADRPAEGERAAVFASLWGLAMFAFFTVNSTKFHHYIFPAVPAFALCVGLLLDRFLEEKRRWVPIAVVGSLGLFAFVARDLTSVAGTELKGYQRYIQLFMYKYDRAWPEPKTYGDFLDYSTETLVFAGIFGVLIALLLVPGRKSAPLAPDSPPFARWVHGLLEQPRKVVVALFCAAAVVHAGWGLHIYFNQISPHWSEGYLVKKYYELRRGPQERLIAYSLNWHGENCYTANRAKILMTEHGFDPEWKGFEAWLKRHPGDTYYFILGKHGTEGLRSKLNAAIPNAGKTVENVSGDISNKYELARGSLCAPEDCPPGTPLPSLDVQNALPAARPVGKNRDLTSPMMASPP